MNKFFLSLLLGLLMGLLFGCASSLDPSEAYKGESPQQIFQAGKAALQNGSYGEAIKRFEALDVQYPFDSETECAQLFLIYAYYMKEDYALAVAAADRYIRTYPASPNVDYAYFMRGISDYYQNLGIIERIFTIDLATRDLTQIKKSYNDFNILVQQFPNSIYAPPSYQYLIYLRNVLANHELQVGQFYYCHRAYVAAANRGASVVAHYQGAPATVEGLKLMARSYRKLGMLKLEQDTLYVLGYNYPGMKVMMD